MKKNLLFATLSLLAISTTTVFAQSAKPQVAKVQAQKIEASGQDKATTNGYVSGMGYFTTYYVYAGNSDYQEKTIDITGFNFGDYYNYYPAVVLCQPRQSVNIDYSYPDAFACQVIWATKYSIRVRIRRLDANYGWGQNLRLDLAVFASSSYQY